jgi:septum formation protein
MTAPLPPPVRLVLASSSPRRRELLAGLGLAFTVRAVGVDETPRPAETAPVLVERLAREKALASARVAVADDGVAELVLAADTTVAVDGVILGKPADGAEALAMLRQLAGRWHEVFTGLAARAPDGRLVSHVECSRVRMAAGDEARLAWYVATGEPMDKAGAYAIQGLGALLVEEVVGNYGNVVGLPLPATARLVAALGFDLLAFARQGQGSEAAAGDRTAAASRVGPRP